ncbi:MAG: TetR/AcrR family transcriptional regulator [Spirochaetaceae bacterium]|nr:MAG: TetR/AcrR family transcriptional regulator [Spirochaetaceae bacterium]
MARTKRSGYREKIIQAASRLIIENGIANTSLADIAREVGISKGTLYYYYPSKGGLIFDISERHMRFITDKIFTWIEGSRKGLQPEELLKVVFRTIISSETRGHIHVYLIQEALTADSSLKARFVQEYDKWAELIEEGLRKINDDDQETDYSTLSRIILPLIDGLLVQHLLGARKNFLDEITRYLALARSQLSR